MDPRKTPPKRPEDEDLRHGDGRPAESFGEDDDNAYQNSDEALPDDLEEVAIARDPGREGGRFDEVVPPEAEPDDR